MAARKRESTNDKTQSTTKVLNKVRSSQKNTDQVAPSVRVIKTADTPNISGTASLTYQLGVNDEDSLMIRILKSEGGGFFSMEWVAIDDILDILTNWDSDNGMTSVSLAGLYRGSVNTKSFIMAGLKAERIIQPVEGKRRNFELGDVEDFMERARQLQDDKAPTKATASKKAPAKAKSTRPRRKPTTK